MPSATVTSTRRLFLISSLFPNLLRLLRIPFSATALPTSSSLFVQLLLDASAEEPETKPGSPAFFAKLVVVLCLVLMGGALAGLTLALMSQDSVNLTVMEASGDEKEKAQAGRVLKLLKKGQHWVLVTLLLYNTITNETLPIFLDSILGGGVLAVASSTALILLFGEVIPQAICSRYGLAIGSASVPFMTFLMYLSYPLSYPIALLLDKVLGHDEGVTYKRQGLKTFVSLHRHLGAENLLEDEVTIISSVLELSEKSIRDIMVPVEDIYSLSSDQILDEDTVTEILRQGYSRVPVYQKANKQNFIGMLLVKNLVVYDPEDAKAVSSFSLIPLPEAEPGMNCLEALNFFQQGRSHMLLVTDHPGEETGALGIVSLEDVIEELIGEEIIDETDLFLDVANKIKVVRRPQIRTGAGKKLTPLLRDAANRRQGGAIRRDSGKLSRSNSDAGSETPGFGFTAPRDYGTISSSAANGGASTPRLRPTGPNRLGSMTSTALAFDKIKIKGVTGIKKLEAMEAIKQNLESIGNNVVNIDENPEAEARETPEPSRTGTPIPQKNANGEESVTITATATLKNSDVPSPREQEIQRAAEEDENAPLLGGKQVAEKDGRQ